jgi:DNA topoisomerase-1
VQSGKETRSLPAEMPPTEVTLEQALALLSQPKLRGRGAARQTVLKDLGPHPESGKPLQVLSGRYGPYVTDGETHASVARGANPLDITPEQAAEMLAQRLIQIQERGEPVKKTAKRGARKKTAKPVA